jgi:glutamine phosphoribosylpyrophosphate amidotransferase
VCGLFAYTGSAAPDPALLETAAAGAATRGPHGYGWAGHGIPARHGTGRLPAAEAATLTALRIIGHARLATMGAAHDDPAGLQPVRAPGAWLAHNGNVYNAAQLDATAPTDSAALAVAYSGHRIFAGMTPAEALKATLGVAEQRAWAVLILDASGFLLSARHRLPLWRLGTSTGAYYSSRPLPGAELIPEDAVHAEDAW